jgi:aspartate beta-hydroxylase
VITDLNYLGRELAREGRQADSRILFQDASRLHLVPSPLQRPVDPLPGLQARPLWDLAQLRAQNRWTSASALTGLGLAGAPLARLEEQAEELAREAAALAEGAGKDPAWRREGHQMELAGAAYTRGLYAWGKKRHETCSHAARACKLIKQFPDSAKCRKCLSKYLVVEAGGRLVPRVGPTNTRLRAVLPLEVPGGGARLTVGGQDVQLQRGKLVVMDDSFENSVWNESAEGSLLLLLVDFHHPDLNDRQKKLAYSEQGQNQFAMY